MMMRGAANQSIAISGTATWTAGSSHIAGQHEQATVVEVQLHHHPTGQQQQQPQQIRTRRLGCPT
jgi:hypothetical protein